MKRVWDIQMQIVTEETNLTEEQQMKQIDNALEEYFDQENSLVNYIVTTLNGTIEDEETHLD
jgi:regulator of sigma D